MSAYRNIVLATDFSDHAQAAFAEALKLVDLCGARLTVVHVIPHQVGGAGELLPPDPVVTADDLRQRYPGADDTDYRVLAGHVATSIIETADELADAVIVIGARGVGVIEALLGGGSVADRVAKNAHCPVLIVPAKGVRS